MHNLRIEALAFECNLQEFHLLIGFGDKIVALPYS